MKKVLCAFCLVSGLAAAMTRKEAAPVLPVLDDPVTELQLQELVQEVKAEVGAPAQEQTAQVAAPATTEATQQ